MPTVFRSMLVAADGLPVVAPTASGLGVRPGVDVDADARGVVAVNGKGMSVAPAWRDLPVFRIPKRLADRMPRASGSDKLACFRFGAGAFGPGPFAPGLALIPDSPKHGCVAPAAPVPLVQYAGDLAATRAAWTIDES